MSLYNFSSVDSEHYNRIKATIPNHFMTRMVNICITTFTSNCNIEVMNKQDYIEFLIDNVKRKVYMDSFSKIAASSLPQILQDIFDAADIKITVSITNIDTVKFVCDDEFQITDMSYNMRLITGFYCLDDSKWPIKSIPFTTKEAIEESTETPLSNIEFRDINMRINDYLPIDMILTPPDAYGYTCQYSNPDESIAVIDANGFIQAIAEGEIKITAEVRNPGSSEFVKADFIKEFIIKVAAPQSVKIETVSVPENLELIETNSFTIYPKITPFYAIYTETWESVDPSIAAVSNGYIRALKAGNTTIKYKLTNNFEEEQVFTKIINITVKPLYHDITKYHITADTVGYMLSTPILYLLTNVGNPVFFNEMQNHRKLQCGTVCMCLNNSYSSSFPIIAQQSEIVAKCALNHASDIFFILVDANMREVKLLNPMYITVSVRPDEEESITPGLLG